MTPLTTQTKIGTLTIQLDESGSVTEYRLDNPERTDFPVIARKIESWTRRLAPRGISEEQISEVTSASIQLFTAHKRDQKRKQPKNEGRRP